jgi:hypothetical protein
MKGDFNMPRLRTKIIFISVFLAAFIFLPVLPGVFAEPPDQEKSDIMNDEHPCPDSDNIIMQWLQKRVTVQEAEDAHLVRDEDLGPDPVPFGFINDDWRKLLSQMKEGDQLWEFRSPPATWDKDHMAGREGIALIRGCSVIATIITLMN